MKEYESLSNYDTIVENDPFRILGHNDSTVWKKEPGPRGGLLIYFHDLKRWVNPPTDTSMEWQAIQKINKYGIEYLADGEEL